MLKGGSVREIWKAKGHVLNGYVSMASPAAAELYAMQGWDTVTLDMEHGSIGFDAAVDILRAMAASGVVPLARIPKGNPVLIPTLLDAGAMGITGAMINTRDETEQLVRACKYPPVGGRGMSRLSRAALTYGPDYVQQANRRVSVFAMIETPEALDNLEAITAVPGLDGIYFGAVDYGLSLRSLSDRVWTDEDMAQAVAAAGSRIVTVCAQRDLLAGMNAKDPAAASALIETGFRFITLSSDASAMTTQARSWVSQTRALFEKGHK